MEERVSIHSVTRACSLLLAATMFVALSASQARAQDTETLTINATVSTRAELVLLPTTINFPDANPTTTPSISADSTVSVTANVRTAGTPTLTVLANGDLISGGDSIAITNVTWTASGAPFIAGTMNSVTAQDAATLSAGSGQYAGTYSYFLANSWTYATGAYTQTATYTPHGTLAVSSTLLTFVTRVVGTMVLTISLAAPASAQALFQLVVTPSTIGFPDANPTTTPSILANSQVDVSVKAALPQRFRREILLVCQGVV